MSGSLQRPCSTSWPPIPPPVKTWRRRPISTPSPPPPPGKPEQQYGDTIVAAEGPDWKEVQAQSLVLLERSRDLRILGNARRCPA